MIFWNYNVLLAQMYSENVPCLHYFLNYIVSVNLFYVYICVYLSVCYVSNISLFWCLSNIILVSNMRTLCFSINGFKFLFYSEKARNTGNICEQVFLVLYLICGLFVINIDLDLEFVLLVSNRNYLNVVLWSCTVICTK